ncbi:MAG: hypothetical protein BGP11_01905 [Rhodobacterales bacterium 65-51]|nr:MAG: hypothetical protein BGP11_01905 [Rhodobacterales bacterium 65-51]
MEASPGGLIRSTLLAGGAAVAILTFFWVPAEYGIDPTGVGGMLGLTEMGEIKQQLYAEAAADDAAAAAASSPTAPVVASAGGVLERLTAIETQIAAIADVVGAIPSVEPAAAVAEPVSVAPSEPPPVVDAPAVAALAPEPVPAPAVDEAIAEALATPPAAAAGWRDEVSYTLAPGEGIEVKLAMEEGQIATFEWTANGGVLNHATHGDGSGQEISYEDGRAVPEQTGELTAAFTGNHGWFWRNRTDAPVTVTLRTGGEYAELKAP